MSKHKGIKDEVNRLAEESYRLRRKVHTGMDDGEERSVGVEITNMAFAYEKIIETLLESSRKGR